MGSRSFRLRAVRIGDGDRRLAGERRSVQALAAAQPASAAMLLMKFFSENHSGDVNNHSGRVGFFIHFDPGILIHIPPERLFTCPESAG